MEKIDALESQIIDTLKNHRGRGKALPRADLVDRVNGEHPLFPISDRTIRRTIKHLVTQHGYAIGSCPEGYFMAETADEIEEVCKYFDSYGLSLLFVSSKLRKTGMRDYLGQLSMRFGG